MEIRQHKLELEIVNKRTEHYIINVDSETGLRTGVLGFNSCELLMFIGVIKIILVFLDLNGYQSMISYSLKIARHAWRNPANDCWNGHGNDNVIWNDLQMSLSHQKPHQSKASVWFPFSTYGRHGRSLSRLPVWRRRTRYQDICVILSTLFQFLDDYSIHSSSQSTSAHSALEAVFGVGAL